MATSGGGSGARRRVAAVAAVAAVGFLGAACGSSSGNGEAAKTPQQIFNDANAAMSSLSSFHAAGTISMGSQQIGLDLIVSTGNAGGSITINGATLQLVTAGRSIYLRGDQASWQKLSGSAGAAQLLADKWLSTTTSNADFKDIASLTNVSAFLGQIKPTGTLGKGATTTYNGTSSIPLTDSGGNDGTLYVAATGKPYFEGVKGSGGSGTGSINFSQFGSAQAPAVPTGAVDLNQLEQGASGG